MTRTSFTFPLAVKNGSLALSSDADRDQQDIFATALTRLGERVLRPFTAGTANFVFDSVNTPNLIAKKLDIAIEHQCPSIARSNAIGRFANDGTMVIQIFYSPKVGEQQSIALRVN